MLLVGTFVRMNSTKIPATRILSIKTDVSYDGRYKAAMNTPPPLLRLARIGLNLSQAELAIAARVSPKTISNLESNVRVRLETKLRVKKALENRGVQFTELDEKGGFGLRFPKDWVVPSVYSPDSY